MIEEKNEYNNKFTSKNFKYLIIRLNQHKNDEVFCKA